MEIYFCGKPLMFKEYNTMDLFDSNGNFLGEGKEIFDSEGNLIGHFVESAKNGVNSAFESSWILGLFFLLIIAPGWTILGIILFLIIKLIRLLFLILISILKIILQCIWWIIRLPTL